MLYPVYSLKQASGGLKESTGIVDSHSKRQEISNLQRPFDALRGKERDKSN